MAALGFGQDARSWVQMPLAGFQASVSFNDWLSLRFPPAGGVGQGSPLSPLLIVLTAQPLASRARQLQRQAAFASLLHLQQMCSSRRMQGFRLCWTIPPSKNHFVCSGQSGHYDQSHASVAIESDPCSCILSKSSGP